MKGEILGTGSFLPVRTMNNHEIAEFVDTSDEWIQERTGVQTRHIITDETTVSMAAEAGRRALQNAEIQPTEIDMIIVATISSDVILPSTACEVQRILGAENAVCFDLNAACCGFTFAYNTAQAYIASGLYQNILIIGSESLTNLVDWKDRGTCILFGDGAGAAVIHAVPGVPSQPIAHSQGWKGDALTCKTCQEEKYIRMDGRAVFQFAVKNVTEAIREVLERNAVSMDEIDYFVLHQANKRIVKAVAKRLDVKIEKFPMNLQKYGNTSSASIPILLDELNRGGTLKKNQKLVMAGFGAGLSWGANILEWTME